MPKVSFDYNLEKDVWNIVRILSNASLLSDKTRDWRLEGIPDKVIAQARRVSPEVLQKLVTDFVQTWHDANPAFADHKIQQVSRDWDRINDGYFKRLGNILNIHIPDTNIYTGFLTLGRSCPFDAKEGWFMVRLQDNYYLNTTAHELMHIELQRVYGSKVRAWGLSPEKFHDLQEALTVLLNEEMGDLLPDKDYGYPEQATLRQEIVGLWKNKKDFLALLETVTSRLKSG
jgi:hypothetical protein